MKARVLIVEDEPLIADDLQLILEENEYEVVGMADNANDCIELVKNTTPDLILLDINIKGAIDGIMLAELLNKEFQIPFIFITSYTDDQTIGKVKVLNPSGFIVKPFEDREVATAVELALHNVSTETDEVNEVHEVTQENLFVKHNSQLVKIRQEDILWAEAYDNYCYINLPEKRYLLPSTLKAIEGRLDEERFVRIHRSYLVNMAQIDVIGENYVSLNGNELPVSKRHRQNLVQRIKTL